MKKNWTQRRGAHPWRPSWIRQCIIPYLEAQRTSIYLNEVKKFKEKVSEKVVEYILDS